MLRAPVPVESVTDEEIAIEYLIGGSSISQPPISKPSFPARAIEP